MDVIELNNASRSDLMGSEKISKLIIQFALPAILALVVSALYNIVDKAFIGQFVGQNGITAVTVSNPYSRVADAFTLLAGAGGNALLAIRLGEKKREVAEPILGNCFVLIAIFSAVMITLGYAFTEPILHTMGTSDEVMPQASLYLRICLIGFFFNAVTVGIGPFLRTDGSPRSMMFFTSIGCVLNFGLDPLMIHVFKWGIAGAAIATVFSQFISFILIVHYFTLGKRSSFKLRAKHLRLRMDIIKESVVLGFSSFILQLVNSLSQTIMNVSLTAYGAATAVGGDIAIAAVGITTSIGMFFLLPASGIQQAVAPILGYNYGAKNYERVLNVLKIGLLFSTALSTLGFLIIMIFPGSLCSLFGAKDDLLSRSIWTARMYNLCLPLITPSLLSPQFFQATAQPRKALLLSLNRNLIVKVPLMFILPLFFGLDGVIYSLPVTDIVASSIAGFFLIKEAKKYKRLSLEQAERLPEPQ